MMKPKGSITLYSILTEIRPVFGVYSILTKIDGEV